MSLLTNVTGQKRTLGNLEYGTQVIVDLRGAPSEVLANVEFLRATVYSLLDYLEGECVSCTFDGAVERTDGASVAATRSGSGVVLHAFPALRRASLRLYSGRAVAAFESIAEFRKAFPIGKVELNVGGRYRQLAGDETTLGSELTGERQYVALRLAAVNEKL
ncbi:MAG: S-adenosylmethionine decarboxylase [Trueperaceae bacterium]|nr:S-adenosylmethionine decarboxylase [Trueperaceae bacterium]